MKLGLLFCNCEFIYSFSGMAIWYYVEMPLMLTSCQSWDKFWDKIWILTLTLNVRILLGILITIECLSCFICWIDVSDHRRNIKHVMPTFMSIEGSKLSYGLHLSQSVLIICAILFLIFMRLKPNHFICLFCIYR